MKAVFYHVVGRTLYYFDPVTADVKEIEPKKDESINTTVADFHYKYRSAISLNDQKWSERLALVAYEKERLAAWNAGAAL